MQSYYCTMGAARQTVYVLSLDDLIIFTGSNLKVVYQYYKNTWSIGSIEGFKSYEQYSRDILKCKTIKFPSRYYGDHTVTKLPLISNLK